MTVIKKFRNRHDAEAFLIKQKRNFPIVYWDSQTTPDSIGFYKKSYTIESPIIATKSEFKSYVENDAKAYKESHQAYHSDIDLYVYICIFFWVVCLLSLWYFLG